MHGGQEKGTAEPHSVHFAQSSRDFRVRCATRRLHRPSPSTCIIIQVGIFVNDFSLLLCDKIYRFLDIPHHAETEKSGRDAGTGGSADFVRAFPVWVFQLYLQGTAAVVAGLPIWAGDPRRARLRRSSSLATSRPTTCLRCCRQKPAFAWQTGIAKPWTLRLGSLSAAALRNAVSIANAGKSTLP